MTTPAPPVLRPTRLIRVDEEGYDLALTTMVKRTGASHAEAAWLLQAVFAAVMLAPKDLMARAPRDDDSGDEPYAHRFRSADCPWGYLRGDGTLIQCQWFSPETGDPSHISEGWHEGELGTMRFHESYPRSLNIVEWRGDTA